MDTQKLKPILPENPTTLDKIIYGIGLLRYHNMRVLAICTLNTIKLTGCTEDIYYSSDKNKMITKAKQIIKEYNSVFDKILAAEVNDNAIISGHLVQIKSNGNCVALIIFEESLTSAIMTKHGLQHHMAFVTVKDTYSGKGKKNNVKKSMKDSGGSSKLSKQEKKMKRYERSPILQITSHES